MTERKNPIGRFKDKPTRKSAIEANCVYCMGGDRDPGYQKRIRECNILDCTLREFRPYK